VPTSAGLKNAGLRATLKRMTITSNLSKNNNDFNVTFANLSQKLNNTILNIDNSTNSNDSKDEILNCINDIQQLNVQRQVNESEINNLKDTIVSKDNEIKNLTCKLNKITDDFITVNDELENITIKIISLTNLK